jgi:phosphonate transport system substrate-binding protein
VVEGQFYRPETLHFATISGADEESSAARQKPTVDLLSEELGMPVEFVETTDYSSVIEAMRAGRVDVALFGPFSYVIASTEANATSLAAAPNQQTGKLGYKSLLITRADSGFDSIESLRGHSMAFADPASTSGNLFPRLMLANAGITDVEGYFSETSFSGGHDASLVAVANGQVDAAGVCDTCIERFYREGLADPAQIRVIAESEPIPPSPVSAREDLDPALRQQITDFYLRLVAEHPDVVQEANSYDEPPTHAYQAVTDDQYDIIRELADTLQVDLAELD